MLGFKLQISGAGCDPSTIEPQPLALSNTPTLKLSNIGPVLGLLTASLLQMHPFGYWCYLEASRQCRWRFLVDVDIVPVAGRARSSSEANTSGDKQVPRGNGRHVMKVDLGSIPATPKRFSSQAKFGRKWNVTRNVWWCSLAFRYGKEMEIINYAIYVLNL